MTPRHVALAGGLVIAGWLAFFADKTPDTEIAEPVARESASAPLASSPPVLMPTMSSDKAKRPAVIMALRPREELIGGARAETRADALFASQNWTPPPPPPPPPAPAPPPIAPPLPFTYLGKKVEDGKWEVYLARDNQTYVVREQSTIEGIYQVQSIAPPELTLTYLPLKQLQTISIGGLD
jgi:hypothetical protein